MSYNTCSSIYNILQHAMMMNTKDTTVTTLTVTTSQAMHGMTTGEMPAERNAGVVEVQNTYQKQHKSNHQKNPSIQKLSNTGQRK